MAINKHGLKISGLKKTSGDTYNYGDFSDKYTEIFYDTKTGEVWSIFQCSLGHNSWTEYHEKTIIKICETTNHMTMQQIADKIYEVVK